MCSRLHPYRVLLCCAKQVLGCLPSDRRVVVKERLLGLLPPSSSGGAGGGAGSGAGGGEGCEEGGGAAAGATATDRAKQAKQAKQAARLAALRTLLEGHVDLAALRAVAARATVPPAPAPAPAPAPLKPTAAVLPPPLSSAALALPPVRIAVARDDAFCFVYHENLCRLRRAGATNPLVYWLYWLYWRY